MTSLWRIFSRSICGLCALPALAATLSGTLQLVDSLDPAVHKSKDYSGVVIWLERTGAAPPSAPRAAAPRARMIQKDKRFIPHVLAIPAGAAVDFPNYDPVFHNAFSNFSGQIFDVGLYPPGSSRTVTFTRPGIVRVFCNIHPAMSAVIAVLDSDWFTVSPPSGAFAIRDVPPGDYRLHIYHERAAASTLKALERKIEIRSEPIVLAPIQISETGHVEAPHFNKYGKEYPPSSEGNVLYPGARK